MAKDKAGASHTRPDFTIKTDEKAVKASQKKAETLREEIASLEQELVNKRKELAEASNVKAAPEAGFSNAAPAKEQLAANKEAQKENAATSTATKK